METNSTAFASYWRNSLVDGGFNRGSFTETNSASFETIPADSFEHGYVPDHLLKTLFDNIKDETHLVEVVLYPFIFRLVAEHGVVSHRDYPPIVAPVVTYAFVARSGRIFPMAKSFIPRDLLEPQDAGSFTLGDVSDLDQFLATENVFSINPDSASHSMEETEFETRWEAYRAFCWRMIDAVAGSRASLKTMFKLTKEAWLVK